MIIINDPVEFGNFLQKKIDFRNMTRDELVAWCDGKKIPVYRAEQILKWLWNKGEVNPQKMYDLPQELRQLLEKEFVINTAIPDKAIVSKDKTSKYAFGLYDGNVIEGVIIPAKDRVTACISTQAGCRVKCAFCATGKNGLIRDLSAGEIFDQFVFLNKESNRMYDKSITNVVYMGMGEPLLNYNNTLTSIKWLTDDKYGQGLSPSRITLSTIGIPDKIRKLADDLVKFQLAVSIHSANQQKREQLIPFAKKYNLNSISESLEYFYNKTASRITIEYVLLKDINDQENDARELAGFCRKVPVKVNLIQYNITPNSIYKPSDNRQLQFFADYLNNKNMIVNIRKSRGCDINAACGQLATTLK